MCQIWEMDAGGYSEGIGLRKKGIDDREITCPEAEAGRKTDENKRHPDDVIPACIANIYCGVNLNRGQPNAGLGIRRRGLQRQPPRPGDGRVERQRAVSAVSVQGINRDVRFRR